MVFKILNVSIVKVRSLLIYIFFFFFFFFFFLRGGWVGGHFFQYHTFSAHVQNVFNESLKKYYEMS